MPITLVSETTQNGKTLVSGLGSRADRGMCLLNDHEFWTGSEELRAASVRLDIIKAHNRERIHIEDALSGWQTSFKAVGGAGTDNLGLDAKLGGEFLLPLVA